jgi:FkbM family methyltransferase
VLDSVTTNGLACRYGTFVFPHDDYVGRSMERLGEYSEAEVRFLCSLLKPGDVVVEAGAHVGTITVPMAQVVGAGGRVLAFEPQVEMFDLLLQNLKTNDSYANGTRAALGKARGALRYSPNLMNTGGVALGADGGAVAGVEALDGLLLDRLDLLKIDVEGMETDVLLGARATIARCRPLIYVENDRPWNAPKLLATLFALDYRVWRHEPPLYNPDNFFGCRENPWLNVVSLNLLAVPVERNPLAQTDGLIEVTADAPPLVTASRWACVARFGGYGDNLMTTSVLPGLRAKYGRVEVITRAPCHEMFVNNPYVDKLTVWPKDEDIGDPSVWAKAMTRRLAEYDFGVHLSHSCESALCFFEAQTQFGWPAEMRRRIAAQSYLGYIHDICGLPHDFAPNFFPTPDEFAKARETLAKLRVTRNAPVVGWVLSGSRIDKAYPGSAAAICRLLERGLNVAMFGAPGKEFLMAKEIERQVIQYFGRDARESADGLYLCMSDNVEKPNWPMRRSLAQIQACDAVVTPDTGPAWAVAMRPMPKVVLLSHASALNITTGWVNTVSLHADPARVPCFPCHQLHNSFTTCTKAKDVDAAACMADIPVDAVVSAVRAGLNL